MAARNRPHFLTAEWTKEDIDEMLVELLGCPLAMARQMRGQWMSVGRSPREELIELARQLDTDEGLESSDA